MKGAKTNIITQKLDTVIGRPWITHGVEDLGVAYLQYHKEVDGKFEVHDVRTWAIWDEIPKYDD